MPDKTNLEESLLALFKLDKIKPSDPGSAEWAAKAIADVLSAFAELIAEHASVSCEGTSVLLQQLRDLRDEVRAFREKNASENTAIAEHIAGHSRTRPSNA